MFERINEDIKKAMKAKEKEKLDALRYLKSMLMENKTSKSPKPEMDVIISHIKKLKDSIEVYPEGSEQRVKIANEADILSMYLPKQLDESDVVNIINTIISTLETPNMGAIMKELSPKIKGQFDGKRANQLVQEALK